MASVTKPKANSIVTTTIDLETRTITQRVRGHEASPLVLRLDNVSPENRIYAALHGFKQRLVDGAAVSRDDDGRIKSDAEMDAEKYERMARLYEHYNSGAEAWELVARSGGGGDGGLVKSAIMRVKGWDEETFTRLTAAFAEKNYAGDVKAAVKFLGTSGKVLEMIAQIKAERAGETAIDADEELANMA